MATHSGKVELDKRLQPAGSTRAAGQRQVALSVSGLGKVYPGTPALKGVDLEVRYGEVHALCGGNGCGKSTTIKILCGVVQADTGSVEINGRLVEAASLTPAVSYDMGFRVVHQDPPLYPDLSVAENIMLGGRYPTRASKISWRAVRRRAQQLIEQFQIATTPDTLLRDLPVSVRTQVAIATALQDVGDEPCVVALDEPTASLPDKEARLLLSTVRHLAGMGHAIVLVSHRLDEILSTSDRVTVMRDGAVHKEHSTSTLTEAELIESILGRKASLVGANGPRGSVGEVVLSARGLTAGPVNNVDLDIRAGEIVGVAGLLGSGRTELLTALFGGLKIDSGNVSVLGRTVEFRRMGQAIKSSVIMIPEDRSRGAAFVDMSVDDNINISALGEYWRGLGFRRRSMGVDAAKLRKDFAVKAPGGKVELRTLSGGNQQKTILARWLRHDARLLLLDEPSQGVDVGARADIYAAIRTAVDGGAAAIVVASDLEELAQFVDRAVILRNGCIVAEVARDELSAHRLSQLVHNAAA